LLQRDDGLCTKAIADDEEVDELEKQINQVAKFYFDTSPSHPIYA
jgi:hypothetical protein